MEGLEGTLEWEGRSKGNPGALAGLWTVERGGRVARPGPAM